MLTVYNSFWYSGVLHLLMMAVNRYVNICYPEHYSRLFSRRRTSILMTVGYVIGTIAALPGLMPCCAVLYDHRAYSARYSPVDSPYMLVDVLLNGIALAGMCFCYTCILFRVRNSRLLMQKYVFNHLSHHAHFLQISSSSTRTSYSSSSSSSSCIRWIASCTTHERRRWLQSIGGIRIASRNATICAICYCLDGMLYFYWRMNRVFLLRFDPHRYFYYHSSHGRHCQCSHRNGSALSWQHYSSSIILQIRPSISASTIHFAATYVISSAHITHLIGNSTCVYMHYMLYNDDRESGDNRDVADNISRLRQWSVRCY